jgi:hypothetical protein
MTLGEPIFDVTDCSGSGYCFVITDLGSWVNLLYNLYFLSNAIRVNKYKN